jgi:hypothetical protein
MFDVSHQCVIRFVARCARYAARCPALSLFCPKDGRLCNAKYAASVLVMVNDAVNISYVAVLIVSFYVLKLLQSSELDRCQKRPSKLSQCNDRKYENGMREMDGAGNKRIPLSSRKATVSGCGIRCAWYFAVKGA